MVLPKEVNMHQYAEFNRRMVLQAYHRYLSADRSLQLAQSEALSYFPELGSRKTMLLGDPGSRLRQLVEHRDRALARLALLRAALRTNQRGIRIRQSTRYISLQPLH
jgi:hypothetical protein